MCASAVITPCWHRQCFRDVLQDAVEGGAVLGRRARMALLAHGRGGPPGQSCHTAGQRRHAWPRARTNPGTRQGRAHPGMQTVSRAEHWGRAATGIQTALPFQTTMRVKPQGRCSSAREHENPMRGAVTPVTPMSTTHKQQYKVLPAKYRSSHQHCSSTHATPSSCATKATCSSTCGRRQRVGACQGRRVRLRAAGHARACWQAPWHAPVAPLPRAPQAAHAPG